MGRIQAGSDKNGQGQKEGIEKLTGRRYGRDIKYQWPMLLVDYDYRLTSRGH
jgi:hypothetical protein